MTKIGAALLIILLLPAVIAQWEARRLPDIFHGALAAGGLLVAFALGGLNSLFIGLLIGLLTLCALGAVFAAAQSLWGVRLMTGSNIKLLAAGATWLTPLAAVLMLLLVALAFLGAVAVLRLRNGRITRPAFPPLAAMITICAFLITNQSFS